ncbi:MAG: CsbD family protein [Mesorhizobium sp.]|uniref:CsbD family protein n=1 Tax=Mesorhizobium sp. TaxID=1871066 RepID=UPI00121E66B5|nr:CsbD family protein [Mesorhizobium sp.]TIP29674.1 MAG: CsbD family protein [Mesorhizobium sp.]
MNKDEVKRSAKSGEVKGKPGKPAGDKKMSAGGTAGKLDESTKKGLGKTEDKIKDRLKG